MSEREKKILESLSESLSGANDLQKEYLLGYAEGMAQANKDRAEKEKNEKTVA